jgi:hypothetical protein
MLISEQPLVNAQVEELRARTNLWNKLSVLVDLATTAVREELKNENRDRSR